MGKTNPLIRKAKKVNGYKINHPHSGVNLLFSFLTLLIALAIGVLTIVPLFVHHGSPEIKIEGLEIFKYIFAGFKTDSRDIIALQEMLGIDGLLYNALPYNFAVIGGSVIGMAVFALVGVILFFITLIRGYSKKPVAICKIAKWEFIASLIFVLSVLCVYFEVLFIDANTAKTLNVWLSFIVPGISLLVYIAIRIIHKTSLEGTVLEKDLYVAQNSESGKPAVNDAPSSNPASTSLPNNLTSINNHQFSKNQDLQTAIIPDKITSIGPGAFANCLNLTNVVIPRSVKNIGYNAFFNCVSLDTITYKGSKAEWRKIKRGSNWLAKAKTDKVICSDSVIIVNQLR